MSMHVITKKSPTTSTTNTSYLSMMPPNCTTHNKRRENSVGEDSVSNQIVWFSFFNTKKHKLTCLFVYPIKIL